MPAAGPPSSRRLTQESGRFTRDTPGSKSLERGLKLLRAFRLGNPVLTNAELAERSGLPRPTVSRLARSLVDAGFLAWDLERRGYRLQAVVLSLAQVYQAGADSFRQALPLMEDMARTQRVNVGMAVGDQAEMVYLESLRWSRRGITRSLARGSRVPMECTSLGYAWLAGIGAAQRRDAMDLLAARLGSAWPAARREIRRAQASVEAQGWCQAMWQPGMMALATPLTGPDGAVHALNLSFPYAGDEDAHLMQDNAARLMALAQRIAQAWR